MTISHGFRLYGDFEFPFGYSEEFWKATDQRETVRGRVELWVVDGETVLRWVRGWNDEAAEELSSAYAGDVDLNQLENLHDHHNPERLFYFAGSDEPIAERWLRIKPPDGSGVEQRLLFRGAWLLDQIIENKLDIRIPLVRQFMHTQQAKLFSELCVGFRPLERPPKDQSRVKDDQGFQFNLGVPVPVSQTGSEGAANLPIFEFCLRYQWRGPTLLLDGVAAGAPRQEGRYVELQKGFDGLDASARVFGQFSFAISPPHAGAAVGSPGAGKAKDVLVYEKDVTSEFLVRDFWPLGSKCSKCDLLKWAGFSVPGPTVSIGDAEHQTDSTPTELSLRFGREEGITVLQYRASLGVNKRAGGGGLDFWATDDESIRLRLPDDLGGWLNLGSSEIRGDLECLLEIENPAVVALLREQDHTVLGKISVKPTYYWKQRAPKMAGDGVTTR